MILHIKVLVDEIKTIETKIEFVEADIQNLLK